MTPNAATTLADLQRVAWGELAQRYVPEEAWCWDGWEIRRRRGGVVDRAKIMADLGAGDDDPRVRYVERVCLRYLRGATR